MATTLELGNLVTGHGHVFVCGKLVHLDTNRHRLWIQAISAPGCSGCPLFDNDKQLVTLVHGSSKHRHHKTKIELTSDSVYCDATLGSGHKFQAVKDNMLGFLKMAEELTEEEARNSQMSIDSDNCRDVTKNLYEKMKVSCVPNGTQKGEIHWDYLMKLLAS
jgi:transcriptional regulator of acetoin/glycerol metabolism